MTKKIFIYITFTSTLALALSPLIFAEDVVVSSGATVEIDSSTTPSHPGLGNFIQNIKNEIHTDRMRIASTTQNLRGEIKNIRKDSKENIASSTADIKTKIQDGREDNRKMMRDRVEEIRISTMARIVWIRINATIVRLQKIVTKLNQRIDIVKSAGGNTTVAETNSAGATVALDAATLDVNSIKDIVSSFSSTTPLDATATSTIKDYGHDAEIQVKAAQTDIEKAIQSLQGLPPELHTNTHASSTTSVEAH